MTTFQPCPEPGARLFVPAPCISRTPTGDHRYAFELWLRRKNGRCYLLLAVSFTSTAPIELGGVESTPALSTALFPAMRLGLPLELEAPVDRRALDGALRTRDVFSTWMDGFQPVPIEVEAATPAPPPRSDERGVASFFSCGVDGFYTLQRNLDDVTSLVFLHGFDVESDRIGHRVAVEDAVARAARELDRELVIMQTNVRDSVDAYIYWGDYVGSVLGASAQLLQGVAHTVLVAASNTYRDYRPFGTNPLTDPLYSTEGLEVLHDGADANRIQKIESLTDWDLALRHLRVCWSVHGSSMNCGHCEKCMRTMTSLFVLGALHRVPTFSGRLDPADVVRFRPEPWDLQHIHQNLEAARSRGLLDTPLMQAWQDCLARSAARLLTHRRNRPEAAAASALRADLQGAIPYALARWARHPRRWLRSLRAPRGRHARAVWNALRGR